MLGFGCGAVGGLMVRGAPADQERAVARAVEAGITYFDTAPLYGSGESERNLGRVLGRLRPNVVVGTKVRLADEQKRDVAGAVAASLEASLRRLGRANVDLFQLHNPITLVDTPGTMSARTVLDEVVPAFEKLREQGKTRCFGITTVGETAALHQVVQSGTMHTGQVAYNLLNPSPGTTLPPGFPAQDYGQILGRITAAGMGAIGIRVLAGGALSAEAARHPIASPPPDPIGSGPNYDADLSNARKLLALITEGHAATLPEAAIRYAISHPAMSTVLIGIATPEQLHHAIDAVEKGPLSATALGRVAELQHGLAA